MSIVVDLPAPFGPSSATVSPRRDRDVDAADSLHGPGRCRKDFARPRSSIPVATEASAAAVTTSRCLHVPDLARATQAGRVVELYGSVQPAAGRPAQYAHQAVGQLRRLG